MDRGLVVYYLIGLVTVLSICFITFIISVRYNTKRFRWFLYLSILFSCYIIFAQYLKYYSLHFYADFAHWAQVLYNIIQTGRPTNLGMEVILPGTANYLSVHFVPLIYFLALFFRFWPYNETIILLNFLLMFSSIIPLYKLALNHGYQKLFPIFMAALFLWYPTFQYTVLYEFEMLRFSIPIILWMLFFWEKKRISLYFLFVILAVFIREEVGLTIAMFGLYLAIFERNRKIGIVTMLIGVSAFTIFTQVVMPALRTTGRFEYVAVGSFRLFGNTLLEIGVNIIKHPIYLLQVIFQPIKLANIFMFFFPLLFIPSLAPQVLLATLANFGVGLLSESPTHISYMLYYLSPSIPFIFYAFIKGWPKLLIILEKITPRRYLRTDIKYRAMTTVFSGVLASNMFFGPSPISLQFWFKELKPAPFRTQSFHYAVYRVSERHRKVDKLCSLIPDSAVVSTQQFLYPRLFKKRAVMIYPQLENYDGTIKADYIFLDKTNNGLPSQSPAYIKEDDFTRVENDKVNWKLMVSEDEYYIYRRITR